jgi:ATPase subunit of ABC transporter with duplicated ATPase domains
MLSVNQLGVQFGKRILFDDVNLQFTQGNCYGIIGANGAGKSTFMKVLSGEMDPNSGAVSLEPGNRMAVLKQEHFAFDEHTLIETVIMGHKEMYDIMAEKNAIYMNPDATEAEGIRAGELENQFGEMGGWTSDSDAAELLSNLGVKEEHHHKLMKDIPGGEKVKVLLAQALFGSPDLLMLDEPTNDLDAVTATWLADFLADYKNTVIVISHDRYFLDMVCTHIVDIDFSKINIYKGNYTFWYESSQLMASQLANKNKKIEQKRAEMMEFIQRFSANASKSKQATSRKKALDKLNLEDIKPSTRKYPFIHWKPEREPGDQILRVDKLTFTDTSGETLFNNVSFVMNKGEKIALLSDNARATAVFYEILNGELEPTSGTFEYGQTITMAVLPHENEEYFSGDQDLELMDWLRQYSENKDEPFIRGFLGRMLFSGEEVFKKTSVLSGGEKVRCMLSKMMLEHPNFLLLSEPTNHLDLESITALNNGLKDFVGNFIMTTHDHELINTSTNRIIELTPNGIIDQLMDFDTYLTSDKVKAQKLELVGSPA